MRKHGITDTKTDNKILIQQWVNRITLNERKMKCFGKIFSQKYRKSIATKCSTRFGQTSDI